MRRIKLVILLSFIFSAQLLSQINVDNYYHKGDNEDWGLAINRAMAAIDSLGHGSIEFNGTRNYTIQSIIHLPRVSKTGKRSIVLNGNGCTISTTRPISIFYRIPNNQKEALSEMMSTRFVINDILFKGGMKGIDLGATYGTSINRCLFIGQKMAAIDIQFGLQTIISQCHSNGAAKDNFVLRSGSDWGGTDNNSQSNHSIIESCRVYAKQGSNSSYKILSSGGCVIRDCISEGASFLNYSIIIDCQKSTTVRLNKVENFHLEHKAKIAALYINSTGICTIDGLFYQTAYENYPLIQSGEKTNQITLMNIPHYVNGTIIEQKRINSGTAWKMLYCHKNFYIKENWRVFDKEGSYSKELPYYFSGEGYYRQINKKEY